LLTGEGEGVGEEPSHTTLRKPGPLKIIKYSLVRPLNKGIKDCPLRSMVDPNIERKVEKI
jgi:hypothetical protein